MKKLFKEFGAFIKKGNVLDLAVGIIIGGAFNAIVKSLVNDIAMPLIGLVVKNDVATLTWTLVEGVKSVDPITGAVTVIKPEVLLRYGAFLQSVLDFLVIAFSVFIAIKVISSIQRAREKALQNLKETIKKKDGAEEEAVEEETVEVIVEVKPTVEEILLDIKTLLEGKSKEKE